MCVTSKFSLPRALDLFLDPTLANQIRRLRTHTVTVIERWRLGGRVAASLNAFYAEFVNRLILNQMFI